MRNWVLSLWKEILLNKLGIFYTIIIIIQQMATHTIGSRSFQAKKLSIVWNKTSLGTNIWQSGFTDIALQPIQSIFGIQEVYVRLSWSTNKGRLFILKNRESNMKPFLSYSHKPILLFFYLPETYFVRRYFHWNDQHSAMWPQLQIRS